VAYAVSLARQAPEGAVMLINLSGRGDKDLQSIAVRESDRTAGNV